MKPASEGAHGTGMVRVATLMPVPGLLREHGVDPAAVFAEFGLRPEYVDDPENTVEFATMARLQGRCAELTHCPHFGLLTGQRDSASALGAVGFLLRNAPDVRTALLELARHHRTHNPNATVSLLEEDHFAFLGYAILRKGIEHQDQILDAAMALGFNMMRDLCGPNWLPTEARFAHARPADAAPYRRFFRATLRFDAGATGLAFARHWLDRVPPGADPLLNRLMAQRVREIESHLREGLVAELRRMLPSLVSSRTASLEAVAKRFCLDPRTLRRRLADEGTSLTQLREEACLGLACQLLEGTRMPANEIAAQIGYSNPSAFTRAFRRWTGIGPAQWRAAKRRTSSKRSDAGIAE